MNKDAFRRYVAQQKFKELFLSELGWNRIHGSNWIPVIEVDGKSYQIYAIAERSGFQVLQCKVDEIPTGSLCRKIDTKLRRSAFDYICIFTENDSEHHLWAVPVKNVEKRDIVTVEYLSANATDFLFSKIDAISFGLTETTTIVDVKDHVQKAFAVNSEKITKDFYTGFRKEHAVFAEHIMGVASDDDRQWYTSIMLNRLMFCYFIQKKGFLDFNFNYLQDHLKKTQDERGKDKFFRTFYKDFLCSLFHEGLNAPNHDDAFRTKYGRIPYLNGGMFDEHQIERENADIDIDDEAFERLFDFFDKWNWHLDTRITASGRDINPDVLGYIFEQYINDRAAMGAYYTKEDITEYIGKNCIIPFLMDKTASATKDSAKAFEADGWIWQMLQQSGDKYIYDAVKKGHSSDWQQQIPSYISRGVDTTTGNLLERRSRWNEKTHEDFALPTEIWRETIERLQRCDTLLQKIQGGAIHSINDFITYNLDIRQFTEDVIRRTSDHSFVAHFYHALQNVTILDPTCGSGAFLFAALNILEPLYEACLDKMEDFHQQNNRLFKDELEEIKNRYRSNRQYFIYKSIILRNLYGVDIMVEATEIAKLRLFLKMVAVVDVDRRADNLGLDPLPDIDFNIKCGNTLVGYATEKELDEVLDYGDMFANQEFKEKINTEMNVVATAYSCFRSEQLKTYDDNASIKATKEMLKKRLATLNGLLNQHMHRSATGGSDYAKWLKDTQPFHWLAEFYQIIHGNGGFDVIIGNPPYVVYTESKAQYKIDDSYKTKDCANLYAYCIERCQSIIRVCGKFGMIVPNSSISANKMAPVQKAISDKKLCWVSNYSWRPSKLFEGADMLLAIILTANSTSEKTFSSIYHKWYNEYRKELFKTIQYTDVTNIKIVGSIPKVPSLFVKKIVNKMNQKCSKLPQSFKNNTANKLYYFRAVQYWFKVLDREPVFEEDGVHKVTGEMKTLYFDSIKERNAVISILSSNVFFLNYIIWSSCQVVNSRDFDISIDIKGMKSQLLDKLSAYGEKLQEDYQSHSHIIKRNYSKKGRNFTMEKQHFFIKFSKPIIDEIDKVLAKHYGFTEEELDFIINYDIKYRMGDELGNEE